MQQRDSTAPVPRDIGPINWVGFATLFSKEVRRFTKVYMQTVLAPVVTTLLFFAVFALALGGAGRSVGDVPFLEFLAPGLIIMTMAQNAFQNTSSSIMIAKNQGTIVDVLMPPMTSGELAVGYVAAAVLRGLVVGVVTVAVVALFVRIHVAHPLWIFAFGLLGTMMLGLLGIAGAIWAEKFDHIAAVTNFIVTPLTFLSGTFYPIDRLPEDWRFVAHLNPFFYMIDGFRRGFIGGTGGDIVTGLVVLAVVNAVLWLLVLRMLSSGYKLKS
jgi:ABC-2 type transport system permease protein